MLSSRAQGFQGKTVELTRTVGVITWDPTFHVVRYAQIGERGRVTSVTDAGFSGLMVSVLLTTGESVYAYESGVRIVA